MRLEIALDHIEDIMRLDRKLDDCNKRIIAEVRASGTTLTRVYGIGPVSAAVILGEVGDATRFASRDNFASYTGAAPISASSGDHQRHRLNRAGNRRLNHALHIAAITQIRQDTPGRVYYQRKLSEGKSHKEALRALKRRISDAVWRQLQTDRSVDQTQDHAWPRWAAKDSMLMAYHSPDTPRANGKPMTPKHVVV